MIQLTISEGFEKVQDVLIMNSLVHLLDIFEEDGYSAEWGRWSIGRGGYDLDFEMSYAGKPFLWCVDGKIEKVDPDFDDVAYNYAVDAIKATFPECYT